MENEEILTNDIEPTPEPTEIPTPEPFVIPNIYNYNPITKEFTGVVEQADKDSAKSAQVGHFVPMVHANATLLEPPTVEENQIQIYSKTIEPHQEPYEVIDSETGESHTEYKEVKEVIENWTIESDYRKNFYKVDNDLNVSNIKTIGEQEGYIVVDIELGEEIKANKEWYKIADGEIVKKSQQEYEQEQSQKERQRLDALTLTPADVERALYRTKGMDFSDLKTLIAQTVPTIDMKALSIEFRAKDFYRGAQAGGVRLFDTIGAILGYSTKDMDYLFLNKELPTDETATDTDE